MDAVCIQAAAPTQSGDGKLLMQFLADPHDEFSGVFLSRRRRRKRGLIVLMDRDPLIHSLAEFPINLHLIVSVDPAEHEAGARAHITFVFFGPFDDFQIPIIRFHRRPP